MKFAKLLILITVLFFLNNSFVLAKTLYSVAPGVLHFDLSKNKNVNSFIVRNVSEGRIRLKFDVVYYPVNSKTLNSGTPLNSENPYIDDLTQSLIISPKTVSLKPDQKRKIRIALRKKKKFKTGDYRAHILVKPVDVKQNILKEKDKSGLKIELNIIIQTAIAVYAHKGKPEYDISWEFFKRDKDFIYLTARNTAPWKFESWVGFFINKNDQVNSVDKFFLYRESKRVYKIKNDPAISRIKIKWGYQKTKLEIGEQIIKLN